MLDDLVWTGQNSSTPIKRRERLDEWRSDGVRKACVAFFHGILNRDKPWLSEPFVADVPAESELACADTVPAGTYLDTCAHLPMINSEDIDLPAPIIRGGRDGISTEEDLLAFCKAPPNKGTPFAILTGQAHVAPPGVNRRRFRHVMGGFVAMPPHLDAKHG